MAFASELAMLVNAWSWGASLGVIGLVAAVDPDGGFVYFGTAWKRFDGRN